MYFRNLLEAIACCRTEKRGGEGRDGEPEPGHEEGAGSDPGRAAPTVVRRQHPGIDGMLAGQTALVHNAYIEQLGSSVYNEKWCFFGNFCSVLL